MLAAFATLVFVATLWLLAVVAALTLSDYGRKIKAALAGRSPLAAAPIPQPVPVRIRTRARSVHPLRARPILRDAA